jgi:DNA-binding NarL/FixJ family response regulator
MTTDSVANIERRVDEPRGMSHASRALEASPPTAAGAIGAAAEIEVLLVDDHLMIRRGLQLMLRADGMRVAGLARNSTQAAWLIARRRVDVALVSASLGSAGGGVQLVSRLLVLSPATGVVLYATSNDPEELARLRASGAHGVVRTSSEPSVMLRALRIAAAGGTLFDPAAAAVPDRSLLSTLSPREKQVLDMLAGGLTALSIAKALHLSPETVRTHVANARQKLGAKTRVQAVALSVSLPRF